MKSFMHFLLPGERAQRRIFKILVGGLVLAGINKALMRTVYKDTFDSDEIKIKMFDARTTSMSIEYTKDIKDATFITNAPMYRENDQQQAKVVIGGYIEDGKQIKRFKTREDLKDCKESNFDLDGKSGIFCFYNDGKYTIFPTDSAEIVAKDAKNIRFAFQNGPILVENGGKTVEFKHRHTFKTSRAGLGITSDGQLVVISARKKMTMQEFAQEFANLGCTYAIYLDGSTLVDHSSAPGKIKYLIGNDFFCSAYRHLKIDLNQTFMGSWDNNLVPFVAGNKWYKTYKQNEAQKLVFKQHTHGDN